MSRLDAAEPIAVRIGDCLCANRPHDGSEGHDDGDIVYLAPQLSLDGGFAAQGAISAFAEDPLRLERELGRAYLSTQITGWNFLGDDGKPIELNWANIQKALPWGAGGQLVAEQANDLYGDTVTDPLVKTAAKHILRLSPSERAKLPPEVLALIPPALSKNGQTATSTSATRTPKVGTRRPRKSSLHKVVVGRK